METVSYILQPYKDIIGSVASVITIIQFFSGAIICKDIYKKGNTTGIAVMPFIGGTVVGTLVLKYAIMLQDKAMFQVNLAAIILNMMYLICYYCFSNNKYVEVILPSVKGLLLVIALIAYAEWEAPDKIEFRYGLIVTMLMLGLMGSPLLEINNIIEKEDVSCIPFPIIFMGFFVSVSWLVYGIILLNEFMIIQNFIGTFLCLTQLILFVKYRGTSRLHKD